MLVVRRPDKVTNNVLNYRVNQRPQIITVFKRQRQCLGNTLRHDIDDPSRIVVLYEPGPSY